MRDVRKEIKEKTEELKQQVSETPITTKSTSILHFHRSPATISQQIVVGSHVKVEGFETNGEVIELNKNKALIAFGNISNWVEIKKLFAVASPKTDAKKTYITQGLDVNEKLQHFTAELNLIGKRGDEAQMMLQQYIDDAFLLGFKQVKIIHGRGYGILRKLIREQLKGNSMIADYHDEHIESGGDAVTVVTLKM